MAGSAVDGWVVVGRLGDVVPGPAMRILVTGDGVRRAGGPSLDITFGLGFPPLRVARDTSSVPGRVWSDGGVSCGAPCDSAGSGRETRVGRCAGREWPVVDSVFVGVA